MNQQQGYSPKDLNFGEIGRNKNRHSTPQA